MASYGVQNSAATRALVHKCAQQLQFQFDPWLYSARIKMQWNGFSPKRLLQWVLCWWSIRKVNPKVTCIAKLAKCAQVQWQDLTLEQR
jgi:hypothetical protein